MLHRDCALLLGFLAAAATAALFMLGQVLSLAGNEAMRAMLIVVCAAVLLVMAGGLLWVMRHLSKNRGQVYGEEFSCREAAAAGGKRTAAGTVRAAAEGGQA